MKSLKSFNEFHDLGAGHTLWGPEKVGQEVLDKTKKTVKKQHAPGFYEPRAARTAKELAAAKKIKPTDLMKHVVKPLSDQKIHKDYTVHHLNGEYHGGDAALLHHKTKGFVGLLNGNKEEDGLHVSESYISPLHRGKKLGVALYDHVAQHHKGIISDSSLSTHSQRIYAHFAKKGQVTVHNPNLDPDERTQYSHGDKVSVKEIATGRGGPPSRTRPGKKKVKLQFSAGGHEDLTKMSRFARLRINPIKKSK